MLTGLSQAEGPQDTGPDANPWTVVFAQQDWYRLQPGPEQEFSGILERVLPASGFSVMQRTAYYQLGGRSMYTGGLRPAALEALLGQAVIVRGKAVDFSLEGASVSEIWPASIRRAAAKDSD